MGFKGATVAAPPPCTTRFKSSYLRLGTILVYTSTYASPRGRLKVLFYFSKHDFFHPIYQKLPAKVTHEKLNNFFHEPMSMLFFCENVALIDTKKITKGIFNN